jgi:peroxin-11B
MGICTTTWAAGVFVEAMKFWFYSLSLGIIVGVVQLYQLYMEPVVVSEKKTEVGEKSKENEKVIQMEITERKEKRSKTIKKIVIDGCDLFIPGSTTGWMAVSTAKVGMLSVVSTVLAATDIWTKVQNTS